MDTTQHIKSLAKLYVFLFVSSIVLSFFLHDKLPPALRDFESEDWLTTSGFVGPVFVFLILGVHLGAVFGLITGRKWAKSTFLFSMAGLYILSLSLGPSVVDAVSGTISDLGELVAGAILGLLIFTRSVYSVSLPPVDESGAPKS